MVADGEGLIRSDQWDIKAGTSQAHPPTHTHTQNKMQAVFVMRLIGVITLFYFNAWLWCRKLL